VRWPSRRRDHLHAHLRSDLRRERAAGRYLGAPAAMPRL
jgi:hypothetical protein